MQRNILHKFTSTLFLLLFARDVTHMTSMKIVQFSRPPTLLCIYVQNSSTPLALDVQFQTKPPNQLKEIIIQGWLLYVIRCFLQFGFRFQYQLINLVLLFFDSFLFSWSLTICFFMALYFCVCSCQKISKKKKKSFIYTLCKIP